ncbi:MAG TPA: cyclopropane-fatty-acyl-phospholipid synthase family protein [Armatimonadota bacterium]|jgi:cyclopropane-fatty-acyl-phospholipid synthase
MLAKQTLHGLLSRVQDDGFEIVYWDGSHERYGAGEPRFTLTLKDPDVVTALSRGVEAGFVDAYIHGRIDVKGDIADVVATALRNERAAQGWVARRALQAVGRAARRRSLRQQQEDVARHYDLGNEFFRLWLDDSMTYSCAYYRSPDDTLEEAQARKIELSLRKLRLQPGEELLDIGCGWGSALLAAAERYGATVTGITLSEEQHQLCLESVAAHKLQDRVQVRLTHYGELTREGRKFDKIISIGMIEHVGRAHLEDFCRATAAMLKPGGLALLHHITQPAETPASTPEDEATGQSIFPGTYCPTPQEMMGHLADNGFHLLTVENLREHYRMTLDAWSDRFEAAASTVRETFGEEFVRYWRLYLRGAAACFAVGNREVHQFLVSLGVNRSLPLTQEDVYGLVSQL